MTTATADTIDFTQARRQLTVYAAAVFDADDVVEVRRIKPDADTESHWVSAAGLPDLAEKLSDLNGDAWNLYVGANPRRAVGLRGDESIDFARCAFADFDHTTVDDALVRLAAARLPTATLVLASGHGCHCYWRLAVPWADLAEWSELQKDLADFLKSDRTIFNPERIMRLPAFLNHKEDPSVPAEIVFCDATRRTAFDDLRASVPPRPQPQPSLNSDEVNARADARRVNGDNRVERCRKYLAKTPDSISGNHGHDRALHWFCECRRFGLEDVEALALVRELNATRAAPPWSEKELAHKLESAKKKVAGADFGKRLREDRPGYNGNGNHRADRHGDSEPEATTAPDPFGGPPVPLDPPAPPDLQRGIFPPFLDAQIFAVADATETPPVLPAAVALVMLATACQGRFCIAPERDYFEELAFWAAAAMEPGTRKTPALQRMTHWLYAWQRRKREEFQPVIDKTTAEHAIVSSRIKQLRDKAAKAKDDTEYALLKQQALDAEQTLPVIPVLPQAIVEDITSEHLATVLGQQGERLSVVSDEGGPLDNIMGRYSDGITNADVYLKGYSGSAGSYDRGSRPSIFLRRPTLSMGLAPQPSVISAMVNHPTLRRRGFPARFWMFLPLSNLGYRSGERCPVPDDVATAYAERLTALMDLPPEPDGAGGYRPRVLKLTGPAWRMWRDFAADVETMMRPDGRLEDLKDWGGKLPGACARVAGLFHCAMLGVDAVRDTDVGDDAMRRAVELARFAVPHAVRVFQGMDSKGDYDTARRLWRTVETTADKRDEPDVVTARQMWHPNRGTFKTVEAIDPAVRVLIDHNYLAELPTAETGKPGRPSRKFKVNPAAVGSGHCGHRS